MKRGWGQQAPPETTHLAVSRIVLGRAEAWAFSTMFDNG